jgi:hypothetical protein
VCAASADGGTDHATRERNKFETGILGSVGSRRRCYAEIMLSRECRPAASILNIAKLRSVCTPAVRSENSRTPETQQPVATLSIEQTAHRFVH